MRVLWQREFEMKELRLLVSYIPLAYAGLIDYVPQKAKAGARSLTKFHGGNRSLSPVPQAVQETSPNARKYEYW